MIFSVFQKNLVLGYSLSNKRWWKPRFLMDYRPLVKGCIANFVIFLDVSEFLRFGWFFPFFKKIGFLGIFGPPSYGFGATFHIGWEMLWLPCAGFFKIALCEAKMPEKGGGEVNFQDKKGISNKSKIFFFKSILINNTKVQIETIGPLLGYDFLISWHTLMTAWAAAHNSQVIPAAMIWTVSQQYSKHKYYHVKVPSAWSWK